MRSVTEHQSIVSALIARPEPVRLALADAAGRVLARDVVADHALPGFDNSAMDGYAVRAADVAGAGAQTPIVLPVAHDIPAGRVDGPALEPGTAHRIMTGALLPLGADAIIPVEATDGGTDFVTVREARPFGAHVRYAGEDVQVGQTVLLAGTTLGPGQLGLISALGQAAATVYPPLRVLVLSTGSELIEPGRPIVAGQVHESNGVMLASAVRGAGAVAEQVHFVADDVEQFHAALAPRLAETDLILTSGGVSAGAYEVVKDALAGRGVEFVKVAMQPGLPQGAGRFDTVAVITLPGNPVSALVSFEVFVRPALRTAMGFSDPRRPLVRAQLAEPLESPAGRRQFRRGVLDRVALTVRPIGPPGSHFLRWLAASDCLIDLGEDVTSLPAGALVDVWDVR